MQSSSVSLKFFFSVISCCLLLTGAFCLLSLLDSLHFPSFPYHNPNQPSIHHHDYHARIIDVTFSFSLARWGKTRENECFYNKNNHEISERELMRRGNYRGEERQQRIPPLHEMQRVISVLCLAHSLLILQWIVSAAKNECFIL